MKNRSVLAFLLALLIAVSMLTGCGAKEEAPAVPTAETNQTVETAPQAENAMEEPAPADEAETRIITDGLGREVEVPAKVERIVTLGNASRMATYLLLSDKMVSVASGD